MRLADFLVLTAVGTALYLAYVARVAGFSWNYFAAVVAMSLTAVVCFQAADIYEVQIFRGHLRQTTRMTSAWAFVFLIFIGASFFAKLGGTVSRFWLGSFFLIGMIALIGQRTLLRALIRRWAQQGRLDRRT
ncbi:MAG TPA: hypothetical protein VGO84_13460, partial [Burkholderiales bacterium]|nr:hypothetical protein [Burkholderiales bacterium]